MRSLDNSKILYCPTSGIKRCEIASIILSINNYRS